MLSSFFAYYTQSSKFKTDIARIRKDAVNQSSFAISDLKNINIPVPDVNIQRSVIEELSQINALIEIKEKQLRELEELEQTIFHEMFGDSVDNEKGWDVKAFSDCFTLKSGTSLPSKKICLGEFPIYGGNGIVGYHNVHNFEGNAIIISGVGALCGNV